MVDNGDLDLACLVVLQQVWARASHQRLVLGLLTCKACLLVALPQVGKARHHQALARPKAVHRHQGKALQLLLQRCPASSAWLLPDHTLQSPVIMQTLTTSAHLLPLTYHYQNTQIYHLLMTVQSKNGKI